MLGGKSKHHVSFNILIILGPSKRVDVLDVLLLERIMDLAILMGMMSDNKDPMLKVSQSFKLLDQSNKLIRRPLT